MHVLNFTRYFKTILLNSMPGVGYISGSVSLPVLGIVRLVKFHHSKDIICIYWTTL